MFSDIRTNAGVPPVGAFACSTGTPLIINTNTGIAYYLSPANVVTPLAGGVSLASVNIFTKNQSVAIVALTDASTVALDASLSNNFELLATSGVGATRKIGNASNVTAGMVLNIWFYQDAGGSRALTWDTTYKFAGGIVPTASTAANAVDFFSLSYSATKGIWVVVQQKGLA